MRKLIFAVIVGMLAFSVQAQQLKVATGNADPTKSTYTRMFGELVEICGSSQALIAVPSSGSVENMDMLINNKVNAAIVQPDVLWFEAQNRDLGNIKTLFTLFPEEVHFLAVAGKKIGGTNLGFTSIGGETLEKVNQLKGLKVGAAGGSVVTAKVIRLQGEIAYDTISFPDNIALIAALSAGKIDAAVLVGGMPLGAVADLGPNFTLLEMSDSLRSKLSKVYSPATVSYPKMGVSNIPTVSADALFLTRDYKSQKFVTELLKLRACLGKNLVTLQEETGYHPKWQSVKIENKGKWVYYDPSAK